MGRPARERFFGEICSRSNSLGCTFGGWDIFSGGCFQSLDIANQSLNQTPYGRRLVPCCYLPSPKADRDLEICFSPGRDDGFDAVQWLISALNGLSSLAGYSTRARQRIGLRSMDKTHVQWIRGRSKSSVICLKYG